MSADLRGVRPRLRAARDPEGKAALFGAGGSRRVGSLVVECGECRATTRVTYADFARAQFPFALWLPPLPGLRFNRRMTCPACARWTWIRARWLG